MFKQIALIAAIAGAVSLTGCVVAFFHGRGRGRRAFRAERDSDPASGAPVDAGDGRVAHDGHVSRVAWSAAWPSVRPGIALVLGRRPGRLGSATDASPAWAG